MKKQEEKTTYEPKKGLFCEATDYGIYVMTFADRMVAAFLGAGIAAVVIYVFFRSVLLILPAGIFLAVKAQKIYGEYKRNKRQRQLLMQFKDLLESLATSYSAGQNTLSAFSDAKADMVSIYGADADIVEEIDIILNGIANNLVVEELLLNFAERSGLEDVESFANVFEVSNRQGSDLKRVVAESREIINDKIEIEMEIETMLAGNKNELNVMMLMPLVIVLSMSSLGANTIAGNTPLNVVVKVVCIAMFAAAYVMGRKVVDIKI